MRCPECGALGYSRKTKTPEWRCRECYREWDEVVTDPIQRPRLTIGYRKQIELERAEQAAAQAVRPEPARQNPMLSKPMQTPKSESYDTGVVIFVGIVLLIVFVLAVSLIFQMNSASATSIILGLIGIAVTGMFILGPLTIFLGKQLDSEFAQELSHVLKWFSQIFYPIATVVLIRGFIALMVVSYESSGGDGYQEECRIEDRGGRIREVCW